MSEVQTRRTDRISLEIRILASGTDATGRGFQDIARTLSISRYGAKIAIKHDLATDHELNIRNIASGVEADFRVVGRMGEGPEGQCYGVESKDPAINLWGINFPPISESEAAVGRVLLECVRCHSQQLVYLNELEVEVFEASHVVSRPCKDCAGNSLWKRSTDSLIALTSPPPLQGMPSYQPLLLPSGRPQDERQCPRVNLQLKACIRTRDRGDDVVTTENVSRGGFCCKSIERYGVGVVVVEVCVPYSDGPGNIFSLARIVHAKPLPGEGSYSYGIAHLHIHKRWAEN